MIASDRSRSQVRSLSLPQWGARDDERSRAAPPPAPQAAQDARRLVDARGRVIEDLRLGVTDRCNLRCAYCLEPGARFLPRERLLTVEELVRLACVVESLGVRRVRLTGGEPTLHPKLPVIIRGIADRTDVEVSLITNGTLADERSLKRWRDAGLGRITFSLDTLRKDRWSSIARAPGSPRRVVEAIRSACAIGLQPVKVNAVLLRGVNDDEATDLADLARELDIEVRFIEYMPLDFGRGWGPDRFVPARETMALVEGRHRLVACERHRASEVARTYAFADGARGRVGFIASVTSPFCGACSRLRITADGMIRPCLFGAAEWDVRDLLRSGADDTLIAGRLLDAAWAKEPGHSIGASGFRQPERSMSAIGG